MARVILKSHLEMRFYGEDSPIFLIRYPDVLTQFDTIPIDLFNLMEHGHSPLLKGNHLVFEESKEYAYGPIPRLITQLVSLTRGDRPTYTLEIDKKGYLVTGSAKLSLFGGVSVIDEKEYEDVDEAEWRLYRYILAR